MQMSKENEGGLTAPSQEQEKFKVWPLLLSFVAPVRTTLLQACPEDPSPNALCSLCMNNGLAQEQMVTFEFSSSCARSQQSSVVSS